MPLREKVYHVIFEAETPAGKIFDVALLWIILASVATVLLESISEFRESFGPIFTALEWAFTILFTIEYALRIYAVDNRLGYVRSFFGIVDLLAVLPTYLSLYFVGAQSLLVIRAIRLLRVFRLFKLRKHVGEARLIVTALSASLPKITVFIGMVSSTVLVMGALMYLVEGEENGFTSIPESIYWAIVTMTTVGYGDITPQTGMGKLFASGMMILGYGIIAVPTGIFSAELVQATRAHTNTRTCGHCTEEGHDPRAHFCRNCGHKL